MKRTVETDIAIIGGGIAGLWLLNQLQQQGFSTILLESAALGGAQTHKAQGIIHGGMKYALQGAITSAFDVIANMPSVWQACLCGEGEIDLRRVPVLSSHQSLWTSGTLTAKLAGFFASIALKGNIKLLTGLEPEFPTIFKSPQFSGKVYSLNEIVIDVHALIRELVKPNQDVIFKIDSMRELQFDEQRNLVSCEIQAVPMQSLQIKAKKYIFTAGSGNQFILEKMRYSKIKMQSRPLHMVIVKHDFPYEVFAHCLGLSSVPRLSITTHHAADGKTIWYIGGQLAEEGVQRDSALQINIARKELQEVFPWLDFSTAEFASFLVNRAEALQAGRKRPDSCFMEEIGNCIIAWPTKLALAPLLADKIMQCLQHNQLKPGKIDIRELRAWPMPTFARPIWDQLL
ncbi:MAG: hypothetical protein ACD_45C00748G0003 [uncultured bacterium]|nr:MAG: hypothetical protein ACD_45C00748G0003 [uncultured bacterium]